MNSASEAAIRTFQQPPHAASRYRVEYVSGIDPLRLLRSYRGDQRNKDRLIWERFVTSLGVQIVDTQNIAALLKQGLLCPPSGCAAIWVQEAQGLCERTDRPFTTIGIHYIGRDEDVVRRNKAAHFIRDVLGRPIDETTAFELCHGERYVIRDGEISMKCPHKGRSLISPAAFPSVPVIKTATAIPPKPARATLCLKR